MNMEILKLNISQYCKKMLENRKRLVVAAVVTVLLFAVSTYFLFDGINKRFLLYTVLCVGSGCLIALPRIRAWYVNLLLIAGYLLLVPGKIFERTELPVHAMDRIQPGVEFANVVIILAVYMVCLLIFQRVRWALGGGSILLLIAFLVNYYVVQFRGTSLTLNDIMAVGTAMQVVDNYQFSIGAEQWYSILYFVFFILLGFWCDLPGKGAKYHAAVSTAALAGMVGFFYFWNVSDYFERYDLQGHYWNMADNQSLNGFLLSFGISIKESSMDKPDGYSVEKLHEIGMHAEAEYVSDVENTEVKPDIIFIMNEAWSDLRVLGDLETSEAYMPFVDSLEENTIRGDLYVEVLGGLTANSEFEALTGDSLTFLASGAIPYQLQVNHDMYALPRVLSGLGYATMAMHPSAGSAWSRDEVYSYFGFDEFIDIDEFRTEYEYVRTFISDACNYNEIIWQYEHRDTDKPWFLFDVTIQNHGSYYGDVEMPITITRIGSGAPQGYLYDVETYLNLMKISDDAFAELVAYFEQVETPTIICMFGDHQPSLDDNFYNSIFAGSGLSEEEKTAKKYITPYLIWANYDIDEKEYGDMSANYLGAVLTEAAGLELPVYYKFLLNLQKEYPVIAASTINQLQEEEGIIEYKMLQYNHLIEKEAERELFAGE